MIRNGKIRPGGLMSTRPSALSASPASGDGAADRMSAATDQAQEKAQDLVEQAGQQAQQVAGQAKSRLREQLDERSTQTGGQINQQAEDLRAVSASLREQGKAGPADAADRLAGYAEQVGSYLSERNAEQLLHDVEDLGRRQPWTVAAGGLALGFAASRFLKASSSRRYSTRQADQTAPARPVPPARSAAPGRPAVPARPPAPARPAAPVPPATPAPPPAGTGL
jgi:hypothetical protein